MPTDERSVPNGIRNETTFSDENDDVFITNTHSHSHPLTESGSVSEQLRRKEQLGTRSEPDYGRDKGILMGLLLPSQWARLGALCH